MEKRNGSFREIKQVLFSKNEQKTNDLNHSNELWKRKCFTDLTVLCDRVFNKQ